MSKPQLIEFLSSVSDDIRVWQAANPADVDFSINMLIGTDDHGGDFFACQIVSPQNVPPGLAAKKYMLVIEWYSWERLKRAIDDVFVQCQGIAWDEVCAQLREHFPWE